jgi:hypothetical protein
MSDTTAQNREATIAEAAKDTTITDTILVDAATAAALTAGCALIQEHVGQTDGGLASQFFDGPREATLRQAFAEYLAFERAAARSEDTVENALRRAIDVLAARGSEQTRMDRLALRWLRDILEQRGCEGWGWIDLTPDVTGEITITPPEGWERLTKLISIIIRG